MAEEADRGSVMLAATPGYVRYVAPTNEVWVTEPGAKAIEIFATSADGGAGSRTRRPSPCSRAPSRWRSTGQAPGLHQRRHEHDRHRRGQAHGQGRHVAERLHHGRRYGDRPDPGLGDRRLPGRAVVVLDEQSGNMIGGVATAGASIRSRTTRPLRLYVPVPAKAAMGVVTSIPRACRRCSARSRRPRFALRGDLRRGRGVRVRSFQGTAGVPLRPVPVTGVHSRHAPALVARRCGVRRGRVDRGSVHRWGSSVPTNTGHGNDFFGTDATMQPGQSDDAGPYSPSPRSMAGCTASRMGTAPSPSATRARVLRPGLLLRRRDQLRRLQRQLQPDPTALRSRVSANPGRVHLGAGTGAAATAC